MIKETEAEIRERTKGSQLTRGRIHTQGSGSGIRAPPHPGTPQPLLPNWKHGD